MATEIRADKYRKNHFRCKNRGCATDTGDKLEMALNQFCLCSWTTELA